VTQLLLAARWKLQGSARRLPVITNQAAGWLDRAHNFNLSARRESSAPHQEPASRSNFLPRVRRAAVPYCGYQLGQWLDCKWKMLVFLRDENVKDE
jgi:hypothetical protein